MGEAFDVLDEHGNKTGEVKDRKLVHQDGAVHRQHVPTFARMGSALGLSQRLPLSAHAEGLCWHAGAIDSSVRASRCR